MPELDDVATISSGRHNSRDDGMNILEAAAYIAGEHHNNTPKSVCSVIALFLEGWNDYLLDDAIRTNLLKPVISSIINTRNPAAEPMRAYAVLDWIVRTQVSEWALAVGCDTEAQLLTDHEPLHRYSNYTVVNDILDRLVKRTQRLMLGVSAFDDRHDIATQIFGEAGMYGAKLASAETHQFVIGQLRVSSFTVIRRAATILADTPKEAALVEMLQLSAINLICGLGKCS